MKINEKYTAEQKRELETMILCLAIVGAGNAPTTQEEFDQWCDEYLAKIEG